MNKKIETKTESSSNIARIIASYNEDIAMMKKMLNDCASSGDTISALHCANSIKDLEHCRAVVLKEAVLKGCKQSL
ncbi:MAG: hypothetical protein GY861_00410 [bacterium]|nr:hypothetical protein [bacterium]